MQTEAVAAGEAFELAAGDSAVFPAGVGGEVRNEGDERATILVADVSPTEEEVGTAAAGTPTP
jgi:quercetin dioxygenase-like cupin family protein